MSCLCIGGVCIPYSALIPCLLIGLQWIAAQFAKVGLLPDFIAKRLGMTTSGQKKKTVAESECGARCCGEKKKNASRSDSVVTTATSATSTDSEDESNNDATEILEHVDSLERWQEISTASKSSTLFVKFTADWCKPCKAIQPAYISMAAKYGSKRCKFITLDVDGDDCDVLSSKMKVAMMPTFICFSGGNEVGRMSGGNSEGKLNDWVGEMCA